jgi:hypothetical protein
MPQRQGTGLLNSGSRWEEIWVKNSQGPKLESGYEDRIRAGCERFTIDRSPNIRGKASSLQEAVTMWSSSWSIAVKVYSWRLEKYKIPEPMLFPTSELQLQEQECWGIHRSNCAEFGFISHILAPNFLLSPSCVYMCLHFFFSFSLSLSLPGMTENM